ncbi:Mur ligase family protein [Demequina lutea]|uniref:Lipid II isoglutaminyl synthase (glutamine-hydrolyzing) subunit MurT n=1 Tax=Demequina lutea TaxID=431489 RepID=A0A7Z0CKB5_9MICO|nr:Mur ligase family protein [Demequina lutea]NYI41550.1 UDP-N-acetylmuramyl tripeptide synthase [Demequina lutea]
MLSHRSAVRIGLLVRRLAQLRGSGTALPGLVVERLDPGFLAAALAGLPEGVVVITGTNGKTTTTKMVVELLRATGLKVFSNRSGSNFTRGIIAGMLGELDEHGKLNADIAVLELDEAHAIHFIREVPPRYSLLLNITRDQLDRFGEVDYTARLLEKVARATQVGVVLNRDDPLVSRIGEALPAVVERRYFGSGSSVQHLFPDDGHLYGAGPDPSLATVEPDNDADVVLTGLGGKSATYSFEGAVQPPVDLAIDGVHNALNGAAALSIVRMVLRDRASGDVLLKALGSVGPAFGRGESIDVDGSPLEIVLVKNPSGFRLSLRSYAENDAATMIAINDRYADGRDTSWLWDVDFSSLSDVAVVSGTRADDMALRLHYDNIEVAHVEGALPAALDRFLAIEGPKRIYCTYTAMMAIRSVLASKFDLAGIQ